MSSLVWFNSVGGQPKLLATAIGVYLSVCILCALSPHDLSQSVEQNRAGANYLYWYGHCMRNNKLGGCGGMLPQENFQNYAL